MRHLRRLLFFVKPYAGLSTLALVMLAAVVVMDLAIPRMVQHIIDEGIVARDRGVVIRTGFVMLGISALSTVLAILNNVFSVKVGEGVARDLREALFLKIQEASFGNLDRQQTGQLLVRLTSDVSAVKTLAQMSLRIGTRAPLLMVGSLALMISTSPSLALTLLPLLLVTSALIGFFVLRMEPLFRLVQERLDVVNEVLHENVAGVRLIKGLVRAEHEQARFEAANEAMTQRSVAVMRLMASMTPALTLCINAGLVVVIWVGGRQSVAGELSLGEIVAFTNYLLTTMSPLIMMTMLSNMWAAGLASLRRLEPVLDSVPDIVDAPDAIALAADAPARVELDDVSFGYAEATRELVLSDVSLLAVPGTTIAILGATGAGKSTLVSLIPRLYDVTRGAVKVGGVDVRHLTQDSLFEHVSLVPQETILFSGTIRDNIRYGRPSASDARVEAAAQAAQAHDFIMRLPQGYESRVAARGANLSGGQKQRLAIARALLVEPRILILDDSTSAVDVATETRIHAAIAAAPNGRTTFLVAQRISTVLGADVIVVLDKGRVVASGTHRELLDASPVYREIYDSQLGHEP